MPDYAGQANAIYDPQYGADKATLDNSKLEGTASLDAEQKTIDPTYNKSEATLLQARNNEGAQQDLSYSTALSGQTSGLLGNQQRIIGEHYMSNLSDLEAERATKLTDLATRRTNLGTEYNANVGALGAKYSGLKTAYKIQGDQTDAANARQDTQRAQDHTWATEAANASAASAERIAASNKPAVKSNDQLLGELFTDYAPASKGGKAGYTESHVIPSLQANGMTYADAKTAAYKYRKQAYGE